MCVFSSVCFSKSSLSKGDAKVIKKERNTKNELNFFEEILTGGLE